jgi:DNA-binding transcriptional MerR regulator
VTGRNHEDYRTISEVADSLDLPQHVLRFWETRFKEIDPVKRAGGRRLYRQGDVELVAAIRHLLYGEGYTIKGVQRILKEKGARAVIEDARGGAPEALAPAPRIEPQPPDIALHAAGEQPAPLPLSALPATVPSPPDPPAAPPAARVLNAEDAKRLRAALAELDECRRLLTLTRR